MRKILLVLAFLALLLCTVLPASAEERIYNGDFSLLDDGWTVIKGGSGGVTFNSAYGVSGYGVSISAGASNPTGTIFYQTVNLTNVNTLYFWEKYAADPGGDFYVQINDITLGSHTNVVYHVTGYHPVGTWNYRAVDVSEYTGNCHVAFYFVAPFSGYRTVFIDSVSAIAEAPAEPTVSWGSSTYYPSDTAVISWNMPSYEPFNSTIGNSYILEIWRYHNSQYTYITSYNVPGATGTRNYTVPNLPGSTIEVRLGYYADWEAEQDIIATAQMNIIEAPISTYSLVEWDESTYYPSDTGHISYAIYDFNDAVFDYYLHIFDSAETKINLPVSNSSGTYNYEFDINAISGYYAARLEAFYSNGTQIYLEGDSVYYDNNINYRITFDRDVYSKDDVAIISYYNAPVGASITVLGTKDNIDIVDYTFNNITPGSSYVTYEFTDSTADTYSVWLNYGSYNLARDYASVAADDTTASMYGYVYDADTNQPIPGAYVYSQTDGVSDTTDADGFYGMIISKGYQSIAVSAPGTYQSIVQNVSVTSSKSQNFYLTYIPIEGYARIYGYVYNYDTGYPLTGVSVSATMSNTTMTRTATATTNQYGYYDLIGLPISSTGSIRFQKTGYTDFRGNPILINTSASVQNLLRYHDVLLFPVGSSGGGTGGGTGGEVNITDPSTTPQDFTGIANNLLAFMMKPAFWGFIFWFGGTVAMIQRRDGKGDATFDLKQVGVVSVVLANILAIIGMWAPYTWYVVVVSWLALAVGFVGFGRQIGGSQGGAN